MTDPLQAEECLGNAAERFKSLRWFKLCPLSDIQCNIQFLSHCYLLFSPFCGPLGFSSMVLDGINGKQTPFRDNYSVPRQLQWKQVWLPDTEDVLLQAFLMKVCSTATHLRPEALRLRRLHIRKELCSLAVCPDANVTAHGPRSSSRRRPKGG